MNGEAVSPTAAAARLDERAWSAATRSAPITIQLVLGVLLITMWLLGKSSFLAHDTRAGERATLLVAIGITALIGLLAGGALVTRGSSTARGIGLSVAASAAVVLIGGAGYAFWIL
jgi:hypothetical protein